MPVETNPRLSSLTDFSEPLNKQARSELLFKVIDLNMGSVIQDLEGVAALKLKEALDCSAHFYNDKELWHQFCKMRVWSRSVRRPLVEDQDRALFHLIRWVMRGMWTKEKCLKCYSLLLNANLGQNPTLAQVEEVLRGRRLFSRFTRH
jgi:hypothetical protein